jgi:hypothetical protein
MASRLRSFEDSIGTSESATMQEMKIDAASVSPNSTNRRPIVPVRNDSGRNTVAAAVERGEQAVAAVFQVSVDVFQHDDRVVDYETDREHDGKQRQRIERIVHRVNEDRRRNDRYGNGERRDQGGAPIAHEAVNDDEHASEREQNGELDFAERRTDELAVID